MATVTTHDRVMELIAFAYEEGIELPMPPEEIAAIEEAGGIVDLASGEVHAGGAAWLIVPTVIGEATAHILQTEGGEHGQ